MLKKIRLFVMPLTFVALAACGTQDAGPVQADNTARNADSSVALTPVDQAENEADLQISANIRRAIVADDSLSVNAQNVKVITSNGIVTLRGPVKSEQEKAAVEAKARQVVDVTQVNSFLEIE